MMSTSSNVVTFDELYMCMYDELYMCMYGSSLDLIQL